MPSKLPIATDGCCAGHKCDNCKICQSGRCCRRDNPDYKLPELGDWDGPIYGDLGVLADDGERVECHCCGEWFKPLGSHIFYIHDVTADEYRAIFGFSRRMGLVSQQTKIRFSEIGRHNLVPLGNRLPLMTPEQILANTTKPARLSSRIKHSQTSKAKAWAGYRVPATKLTDDQVRQILSKSAEIGESRKLRQKLAQEYDVSEYTIRDIQIGRTWKVLRDPERLAS